MCLPPKSRVAPDPFPFFYSPGSRGLISAPFVAMLSGGYLTTVKELAAASWYKWIKQSFMEAWTWICDYSAHTCLLFEVIPVCAQKRMFLISQSLTLDGPLSPSSKLTLLRFVWHTASRIFLPANALLLKVIFHTFMCPDRAWSAVDHFTIHYVDHICRKPSLF